MIPAGGFHLPRTMAINTNLALIVHRLLTDPDGWQVSDLCHQLDITDRTYRKYRALVRELPPFAGPGASFVVDEVKVDGVRWLRLLRAREKTSTATPDFAGRLTAAHLTRQLLRLLDGTEVGRAATQGWAEFEASLADRTFVVGDLFRDLDRMVTAVSRAPKDYRPHAPVVERALHHVLFRRTSQLRYQRGHDGAERSPVVDPYSLLLYDSALYLVARDHEDDQVKLYAIDRVAEIEPTGARFAYPSRHAYDPEALFADGFGVFRRNGAAPRRVVLEFDNLPWLHRDLQERQWHHTQRFEALPDGRLRMEFETEDLIDVAHWLFGRRPFVRMVTPTADEWSSMLESVARSPGAE